MGFAWMREEGWVPTLNTGFNSPGWRREVGEDAGLGAGEGDARKFPPMIRGESDAARWIPPDIAVVGGTAGSDVARPNCLAECPEYFL